jgi:hypothetical protein
VEGPALGEAGYWVSGTLPVEGGDHTVIVATFRVGSYGGGLYAVAAPGAVAVEDLVPSAQLLAARVSALPPIVAAPPPATPTPVAAPPTPVATPIAAPAPAGAPSTGGGVSAARTACPPASEFGSTWQEDPSLTRDFTFGTYAVLQRGYANRALTGPVAAICALGYDPAGTIPNDAEVLASTQGTGAAFDPRPAPEVSGPPVGEVTHWIRGQRGSGSSADDFIVVGFRAGGAEVTIGIMGAPGQVSMNDLVPVAQATVGRLTANPVVVAGQPSSTGRSANVAALRDAQPTAADLGSGWTEDATGTRERTENGVTSLQRSFTNRANSLSTGHGPFGASSYLAVLTDGTAIGDSIVTAFLRSSVSQMSPGATPTELTGPAIGEGTRWLRVPTRENNFDLDILMVVYRAGGALVELDMVGRRGDLIPDDLAPAAQAVAARLGANPAIR